MTSRLKPIRARIPLSVPHLTGAEGDAVQRAIDSNWIAPIGPEVDAFEEEVRSQVGAGAALATTSGTAAIHLALRVLGVGEGDEVLVSTLTFCASANPALYQGARPVFVDADLRSWNMDPVLLADEVERMGRAGRTPAAVVVVHLFGQLAEMAPILEVCSRWEVPVVEDAAAAMGSRYLEEGRPAGHAGALGDLGIYSFDGSKMITTSMGGMLLGRKKEPIEHARKLARQAREPVAHYEHEEIGFNYRMSNLLAAFGRAQLPALPDRVRQRRAIHEGYRERLSEVEGIGFQPEVPWSHSTRWLTAITLDPERIPVSPETLRLQLLETGIESRPLWKPLHLQPVYRRLGLRKLGGEASESLFRQGLCLPSSSSLEAGELDRICHRIKEVVTDA